MSTIIIVDDEIELRENLQDLLEFKGYEVFSYPNGEEMLEAIDTVNSDIFLLDYQLPGLNGIELIPRIREKIPHVPIGLVTASSQPETREEAEKQGANQIILKPYSPMEMLQTVEEMLGSNL